MKITRVETFFVDIGWSCWTLLKMYTDEGVTGVGECTLESKEETVVGALRDATYERTILWRVTPWPQFALNELIIHGQDIRRPLRIAQVLSVENLMLIADTFIEQIGLRVFRKEVPRVRFEATDADWSHGDGPMVRGPLEAIVMVLAGRRAAVRDLIGEKRQGTPPREPRRHLPQL